MSVPGIVQSTLDGDEIAARVPLGGDDELFVTSSKTVVYRSDGLLSDESIEEYPHEADRLTLSEGRRKTTITLEYPLEGAKEFAVPASKTDAVLHPVLAGVLNGNGITDAGETVVQTYRFSEMTVLITSDRLVKHIGAAVWDEDYEEFHFGDVTNLAFEDGSVATQVVLTVDGRPQRIKAPNEQATDLRERLQRALFEYHDVESLAELNATLGPDDDEPEPDSTSVDFGDGVDPLDANPPEPDDGGSEASSAGNASEPAGTREADSLANGVAADSSESEAGVTAGSRQSQHTPQDGTQSASRTGEPDDGTATTGETANTFDMASDEPAVSRTDLEDQETSDASTDGRTGSAAAAGADHDHTELVERIESLEATVERQSEVVERQTEVIEHQQETIEQLIAELRAGR